MANFEEAFEATMAAEGEYVDDPKDPGGETYKGVARSRNPNWLGFENLGSVGVQCL
jgi:lysozyme family protein